MRFLYDIFISYNHKDRANVKRLTEKLTKEGYKSWLDEWEVKVGDRIIQKVSLGLEKSRFVAIWLTNNSVKSNWVENEWQAKYYQGIEQGATTVLPLLGEKCEIPFLLKPMRYADFSSDFDIGLNSVVELLKSFSNQVIEEMRSNLAKGFFPEESAKRLYEIALYRNEIDALEALWLSLDESSNLTRVVDHCAWCIGKLAYESSNPEVTSTSIDYIYKSINSRFEIIIDKFAYTACQVYDKTPDYTIKRDIISFIAHNSHSKDARIRRPYKDALHRLKSDFGVQGLN
jgi:TIR domain